MARRPTITLALCLAAGLAFGIGLARPGIADTSPDTPAGAPAATPGDAPASTGDSPSGGYGEAGSAQGMESATPTPAPADPGGAASIDIEGFAFSGTAPVATGASISIQNRDGVTHTLTAEDGSFDTGRLSGGSSATLTAPATPGTYRFFCSIHPSMTGSLVVGS